VRQLLTHTSGYGYAFWSEDLCRLNVERGTGVVPSSWEELEATPLLFDPGTAWAYGISTDVLGKLIEAVSEVALDEYLRTNVLGPMGMHDTTITLTDEQRTRAATIHVRNDKGIVAPLEDRIDGDRRFAMGGGSLCGTGPDYVRFLQMLLGHGMLDGERILQPSSVAAMAADQLSAIPVTPLRTAMPDASNDVDLLPGVPLTWGLGFQINTAPTPAGRCSGSLAWAGLYNTYFWVDHSKGVGGVVLTQLLPFADAKALELLDTFERAAYAAR
jgi:CubicO group peptidase (beta-lactamase class C family)